MNCPRCKTAIAPLADPDSVVLCPGCGSRLMTRSAARRSQGAASRPAELPPSATLPPTPARELAAVGAPTRAAHAEPRAGSAAPDDPPSVSRLLDALVREVRALRVTQDQILSLLEAGRGDGEGAASSGDEAPVPIRARQRKTVVLIDDDPATRAAAVAEMQQADVPVRAFEEGNAALSGIAEEKPDLIVLELAMGGDMAGKDVINMIKATMEWVDLPIVLWTRLPVASQKEARQIHGADEVVPKSAGAPALLARVITLFRRG